MANLNPQIREFQVGARELITIKLYPLSIKDEQEIIALVVGVLKTFSEEENVLTDEEVGIRVMGAINDNLGELLKVCSEPEVLPGSLTNQQLSDLLLLLFEVNFEGSIKNFKSLIEKMSILFPSMRQSPGFVNGMDTLSMESLEKLTGKGD